MNPSLMRPDVRDRESAMRLFDEHRRLAFWVLSRWCRKWKLCKADYESAALYALWRACQLYENRPATRFSTYAVKCIKGALLSEWSETVCGGDRRHRRVLKTNRPTDQLASIPAKDSPDTSSAEWCGETVKKLLQLIAFRQAQILKARMSGVTLDECGRQFQISRARVRQIEARGILAMRDQAKAKGIQLPDWFFEDGPDRWERPARRDDTSPIFENCVRALEDADQDLSDLS